MKLKMGGASVRQVAEMTQVSVAVAHKDIHRALGELAKEHEKEGDQLRDLMMARYEQILLAWWALAVSKKVDKKDVDLDTRALATDKVLSVMRGMRSIWGLDPTEPIVFDNRTLNIDVGNGDARDILAGLLRGIAARNGTGEGDPEALPEGG